jgi:hypothetical protein
MQTVRRGSWAYQEFGDADLGNLLRRDRLVAMAAQAAATPGGKVTEVFSESATREGAYRLLENDKVAVEEIAAAAHRATARRCYGESYVFVPVDGSSLSLTDRTEQKGLGVVGKRSIGALGLQVMTAIAVEPDGAPVGLCGQRFWTRPKGAATKKNGLPLEERETRFWLDVMKQVQSVFTEEAPSTRPWFQCDRGGDAWPVIAHALDTDALLTVRATHSRRLEGTIHGRQEYLWPHLASKEPGGHYALGVPAGKNRTARTAWMVLQWSPVVLDLEDTFTGRRRQAPMWAVRTVEQGTTPPGEERIEWMLLTTHPVNHLDDARLVLVGYAARWRIEEFHRIWKTGACRVEETQLEERENIERWATILASVAMRILRLTYLTRTAPEAPATEELSRAEIQAVIRLRRPKSVRPNTVPNIGDALRWIADLGGYTGKSSGGPPGALVIARGLRRMAPVADILDEEKGDQW